LFAHAPTAQHCNTLELHANKFQEPYKDAESGTDSLAAKAREILGSSVKPMTASPIPASSSNTTSNSSINSSSSRPRPHNNSSVLQGKSMTPPPLSSQQQLRHSVATVNNPSSRPSSVTGHLFSNVFKKETTVTTAAPAAQAAATQQGKRSSAIDSTLFDLNDIFKVHKPCLLFYLYKVELKPKEICDYFILFFCTKYESTHFTYTK
jgi:hypothetical protein